MDAFDELIDGSGLDMIGFERLPEQQIHQMSTHRLYFLREEYRKYGMPEPLIAYLEGIFVPTEPGACTWQEQADMYHRWTLLSLLGCAISLSSVVGDGSISEGCDTLSGVTLSGRPGQYLMGV